MHQIPVTKNKKDTQIIKHIRIYFNYTITIYGKIFDLLRSRSRVKRSLQHYIELILMN